MLKQLVSIAAIMAVSSASHFDDLDAIENFSWDHVSFLTKKDCALDNYPDIRQFLEVESAHYRDLDVRVASDGMSRMQLYKTGKHVDTIHVYKYNLAEIRNLLEDLGLSRDEKLTWKTRDAEREMAEAFNNPMRGKSEEL
tara:strand:+ start:98 stop:517 length:420 start_codon:yes stop_codon:yes gene_type:complete